MASDGSTSETTGLTSAPSVVELTKSETSSSTPQLQEQGTEAEGTKGQAYSQNKETESDSHSKDVKESTVLPATASSSPVLKSPEPTVKSPTATRKPHVLSPLLRFPLRIGITWKKGERLEAMDFSKTWYPSRIVEINEDTKSVLIHFDGWNSRYDEWLPMASEKLRPPTRHSERKDKKSKNFPQPIYRRGEGVLARWTDCKKYPAKISRLMPDGTFEVVFYDGVTRNVQPINVQPLPEGLKQAAEEIQLPAIPSQPTSVVKSSFKSVKLELPESVLKPPKTEVCSLSLKKLPGVEKRNRHMEKSIKKSLAHISGTFKTSPLKARRLKALQDSSKKKRKKMGSSSSSKNLMSSTSSSSSSPSSSSSTTSSSSSGTSSPSSSTSSSSLVSSSSSSSFSSTTTTQDTNTAALPGAAMVSTSTSGDLKMVLKISTSPTKASSSEQPVVVPLDKSLGDAPVPTLPAGAKRVKKRSNTDPTHSSPRKKRKKKLKEAGLIPKGHGKGYNKGPPRRRVYSMDLSASSKSVSGSPTTSETPLSSSTPGLQPPAGVAAPPVPYFVPSKAFVVEEDHNPYKCPFDGCVKEFRKENLLASHIKHYHDNLANPSSSSSVTTPNSSSSVTAVGTGTTASCSSSPSVSTTHQSATSAVAPGQSSSPSVSASPLHVPLLSPSLTNLTLQPVLPTRRRRRKTDSFCSTDSDMSVSSKGRSSSSKRQRHDSEISVTGSPDIMSRDLWADVKLKAPQDSLLVEDCGETEEEEVEKDLVNCICQIRETNGLMIQCDVCMCWQHFTCVDTEGTGRPPTNYVCLACERPKGVRDSCKYLYDLGWERRGELPTFPFLGQTFGRNTDRMRRVAKDCIPLTSCLMDIKAVLHSTRRQIKISKEEDEPEFQLWQTDWDNWTKPEEDLTLTPPRSVEAAPSPAPSTFMFPPASHSPPLLPQPPGSSLTGFPQAKSSSGIENLPPTSVPPSPNTVPGFKSSTASPSSLSPSSSSPPPPLSITLPPNSYQDSFKSWLTTAENLPKKSSLSSVASPPLPNSMPPRTPHPQPLLTPTPPTNSNNAIQNSSTEYSDILASSSSTVAAASASASHESTNPSSPSSSSSGLQSQGLLDNPQNPPNSFNQSLSALEEEQQESVDIPAPRSLSLDTHTHQSQQEQELTSPHLTPPMNSSQQQALVATLSQTPSSARSCRRISSLSSTSASLSLPSLSSSATNPTVADGDTRTDTGSRSDLGFVRRDIFTIGPGGDAPTTSSSLQQSIPRPLSTTSNGESRPGAPAISSVSLLSSIPPLLLSSVSSSTTTSRVTNYGNTIHPKTASPNTQSSGTGDMNGLAVSNCEHQNNHPHPHNSHSTTRERNVAVNSVGHKNDNRRQRKESVENCSDADGDDDVDDEDDDDDDSDSRNGLPLADRRGKSSSSMSERFGQGQGEGHPYHRPLRELFIDVNSGSVGGDVEIGNSNNNMEDADDDNDTDTAEESVEPYRDCERNLLVHISRTHDKIDEQLEEFERQIEELEGMVDQNDSNLQLSGNIVLNDVPALKKSLGKLTRSLGKIQHLSMYR